MDFQIERQTKMKINGKKLSGPNKVFIALPREGGDVVFIAQGVLDYDEFNTLCPIPKPPRIRRPGDEESTPDFSEPKYQESIQKYGAEKSAWMIMKSLEATEGLEFETVKKDDHTTWTNIYKELKDSGLCDMEITRIIDGVMEANCLSDERVEEARNRFLASKARIPVAL
jgi:hypothetical protein